MLIIFAALTPCARSATRGFVGVRCLTFTICTKLLGASFDDTVDLVYGRNTCFQVSPRERNFAILDPTVNEKCERTNRPLDQWWFVELIDADAVSCAVHVLGLEPYRYLSSGR